MNDLSVIKKNIINLLRISDTGNIRLENQKSLTFQLLQGDGSSRKFIRISYGPEPLCIAVLPASSGQKDMAEYRAAVEIGRHLFRVGTPVPRILGIDDDIGLILFEDLGDTRLHDVLVNDRQQAMKLYRQVVKELANLQVCGAQDFDQTWCYDTISYDTDVMLTRESGYFVTAFLKDIVGREPVAGLVEEFEDIAAQVMAHWEPYFLHRDFQSRNIMVQNGDIRIIDFQAGRLGPLGYDLASLLIDPYAGLTSSEQDELFFLYCKELSSISTVDINKLKSSYPYLAIQRNMQIIGAFCYLSGRQGKGFFKPYILPSLVMLKNRLKKSPFKPYSVLKKTITNGVAEFSKLDNG